MLATYVDNIYLIERLDYYRDLTILYGKQVPKLLFMTYCGTLALFSLH